MKDQDLWKLPTAEEVLAGEMQAGVTRPAFDFDDAPARSPRRGWWARLFAWLRGEQ